jgi:hypothetical protein
MKNKILYIGSILIILSAIFLIVLYFFWSIYPYNPITIKNSPFPVLEKQIKAGDTLTYIVDYCKDRDYEALVTRTFEDGIEYSVPANASNKSIGCHKINVGLITPKTLPPATYWLEVKYSYKVNPIRTIEVVSKTQLFKIVK